MHKLLSLQLLQTMHRLRIRLLHEYDENADLIARAESQQFDDGPDIKKFTAVNDALDRLEQAILRVDRTYMLFSAFGAK